MNALVMAVGNNVQWECLWKDTVTSSRLRKVSDIHKLERTTDKLNDIYRPDNSVHGYQNEENIHELSPSEYASDASEHDSLIPKKKQHCEEDMISACDLKQGIEKDDLADDAIPWPSEAWLGAQCYLLGMMDDAVSRTNETGGGENVCSAGNTARLVAATPRHLLNASLQNTSTVGAGRAIETRHSAGKMTHATLSSDRGEERAGLPPYLSEAPPTKATSHDIVSIEHDLDYIKSVLSTTHLTEDSDTSCLSGECSDTFEQSKAAVKRRMPGRRGKTPGKQRRVNELGRDLVNEELSRCADVSCLHHRSDACMTNRHSSEVGRCTNVPAPKCSSSAWVTKALNESNVALHQRSSQHDHGRRDGQPVNYHDNNSNNNYNNNNNSNNNGGDDDDDSAGCIDFDTTSANTTENSNSGNTNDGINSDINVAFINNNNNNKYQQFSSGGSALNDHVNGFDGNGMNQSVSNGSDSCVDSWDDTYSSSTTSSSGPSSRGGHHAPDRRNNNNSRGVIADNRRPNGSRKNINNNVSATNYAEQTAVSVPKEQADTLKLARKTRGHPSGLDETLTNGADIWWMRKAILVTYYYPNRSREHFPMCPCLTLRYVLYIVLVMICVASFVGTVYVGSNFGTSLATKWLYYSGLGIAVQLVILEPIKVVLIAGFYAFVQKRLL